MTPEQFWEKVDRNGRYSRRMKSRCWEWTGPRAPKTWGTDYGQVHWGGRTVNAHRIAWELTHGVQIPKGLMACHSCDYPPCVNLGTAQHNAIDRALKGRHGRIHDHGPFSDGRINYAPPRPDLEVA